MPVYVYEDTRAGGRVELVKSVAERDAVPAHLKRITVPQRVAIHGTTSSPIDGESAEGQVPAALKALSNNEVNQMVHEGGMSVDTFKRTWNM